MISLSVKSQIPFIHKENLSTLDELEKEYIIYLLKHTGNNVRKTAKILNISRTTLYNKLEKFNIPRQSWKNPKQVTNPGSSQKWPSNHYRNMFNYWTHKGFPAILFVFYKLSHKYHWSVHIFNIIYSMLYHPKPIYLYCFLYLTAYIASGTILAYISLSVHKELTLRRPRWQR